jgi:hypothetical protein
MRKDPSLNSQSRLRRRNSTSGSSSRSPTVSATTSIFDLRPRLVRVQCKWATRRGDVVGVRAYSCRRAADGLIRRGYSSEEIDAIAAYCLELDACYFIPLDAIDNQRVVQLRLRPTRNNQRRRIRWAEEFDFAATLRQQFGAVAQLGERRRGTPKVTGSSPVGSTLLTSRRSSALAEPGASPQPFQEAAALPLRGLDGIPPSKPAPAASPHLIPAGSAIQSRVT